ncbi:hypothetical protein POTOM_043505 [Populus tomentosa]|uniref:Uncharacterized protein n=1 Tax=Populus tomentosa TaxID=118781 RepID=A0A8X7YQL2_POPTO|nr:hypothetical protein POTOM_043505 [Populus tomentosa]
MPGWSSSIRGNEIVNNSAKSSKQKQSSLIQNVGSCYYTVVIKTSCSSPRYTRDHISIAFVDAYGNQVWSSTDFFLVWNEEVNVGYVYARAEESEKKIYAQRLDDPSTRTFERCSSDSFQISGPCAYQICSVYLYRSGPDGWKPATVRISGY